jgi:fused signal recognition particle receptor
VRHGGTATQQSKPHERLGKIRRVFARELTDTPCETLLVLDAVTGQKRGLRRRAPFAEVCELDGVFLTMLDGTAKGGA